jgi:hypothetical protein
MPACAGMTKTSQDPGTSRSGHEHVPIGLAVELAGHTIDSISGRGWSGIKNGELLRRMSGQYDVLLTMDRSIEFQQRVSTLPFGIALVRARSNRMEHLRPLVASILFRPRRGQPWAHSSGRLLNNRPRGTFLSDNVILSASPPKWDADYGRNLDRDGAPTKAFEPSLFV